MIKTEKYQKFLYALIKTACPILLLLSLFIGILSYPVFSTLLGIPALDFSPITKILSVFIAGICLCRLLVSITEKTPNRKLAIDLLLCVFASLAAYFLRGFGGFTVSGYVFPLLLFFSAPFVLLDLLPDKKRKKTSFAIAFAVSAILFLGISLYTATSAVKDSSLMLALLHRILPIPLILLGTAALFYGKCLGIVGALTEWTIRLFFAVSPLILFATARNFALADSLRMLFPIALCFLLLISALNAAAIRYPSKFPRFFSI